MKKIKVAVLDDYQDVFQQIVETEKYKEKFDFHIFKEPFLNTYFLHINHSFSYCKAHI